MVCNYIIHKIMIIASKGEMIKKPTLFGSTLLPGEHFGVLISKYFLETRLCCLLKLLTLVDVETKGYFHTSLFGILTDLFFN